MQLHVPFKREMWNQISSKRPMLGFATRQCFFFTYCVHWNLSITNHYIKILLSPRYNKGFCFTQGKVKNMEKSLDRTNLFMAKKLCPWTFVICRFHCACSNIFSNRIVGWMVAEVLKNPLFTKVTMQAQRL